MTIQTSHRAGTTFCRSFTVQMPGFALPPTGSFALQFRTAPTAAPKLSFTSERGSIHVESYNSTEGVVKLVLLAGPRETQRLDGLYRGNLVYQDGPEVTTIGDDIDLRITPEGTSIVLPETPAFNDLALWPDPVDLAGESQLTILAVIERGLPGPQGIPGNMTPLAQAQIADALAAAQSALGLSADVTTKAGQVSAALVSINQSKGLIDAAKTAVDTAKGQVDTAKAAVDVAKGQVDTAKAAVDVAKGQVDVAKGQADTTLATIRARVLPPAAADPTVDETGAAVIDGATYWSTAIERMKQRVAGVWRTLYNTIVTTAGAPAAGVGVDGDYAIDPAAKVFYGPKAGGAWPASVAFGGMALKRTVVITSSGTFTKSAGDVLYVVYGCGGSGGGGSGARSAPGTAAGGGGGGSPGGWMREFFNAADLPASFGVTIGAGGAGGAAAGDSSPGNAGGNGGHSYFNGTQVCLFYGYGGAGGTTAAGGAGGAAATSTSLCSGGAGGLGAAGSPGSVTGTVATTNGAGPGAGGGGGGVSAANVAYVGAYGQAGSAMLGASPYVAGGTVGANGGAGSAPSGSWRANQAFGGGGSGGGGNTAGDSGNGGDGGNPGGGGGGGGGGRNGYLGGAGGAGAPGRIVVFVFG